MSPIIGGEVDVKLLMRIYGVKSKDVAAACGVTAGAVSNTINGVNKSYRIRKEIATRIGINFEVLWGEPDKES